MKNTDLYYRTSIGTGNFVKDEGISPCIFGKETKEDSKKEFEIFIFGGLVNNTKEVKSPLFLCRNLISCLRGQFIGKERASVRASHLAEALNFAKANLKNESNTNIVVLDGIKFDCDNDEFENIISNMFAIIYNEMVENYNVVGQIAIYCYFDTDKDYELSKKYSWDCSVVYDENNRAVLLAL